MAHSEGMERYRFQTYYPMRVVARFLARTVYRLRVRGHENVPAQGPVLLICNHVSFVDWMLVAAGLRRPVHFVMDHAFFRGRALRWVLRRAKVIPIAAGRENPGQTGKAYESIAAALAAGGVVCIFPEGQITYDGKMNGFKAGVIKVLRKTPVPVVPMALHGLWGTFFSRYGGAAMSRRPKLLGQAVELRIGEPIPAGEIPPIAALEERVRALT